MFPSILFISAIALSTADVFSPKPCCVSNQFQATLHETGGQINPVTGAPEPIDTISKLYYNYDLLKMRLERKSFGAASGVDVFTVILDYTKNTTVYMKGSVCLLMPLQGFMQRPCIPDDALYTGRHSVGSYGSHVTVDGWRIVAMNTTYNFAVTTEGCTPVIENIFTESATAPSSTSILFSDVQEVQLDHSLFATPANCHKQT